MVCRVDFFGVMPTVIPAQTEPGLPGIQPA
jgi:hypothetical protein